MAVTVRRRVEGAFKFGIEPIGPKDGTNRTYLTPEKFRSMIGFYRNGVKLLIGSIADYTIDESGGPGTGYDTLVFVSAAPPPKLEENLQVDYIQQ
jgi:hypothetical protein